MLGGTANCYDSAFAESFFASLKMERLHQMVLATRTQACDAISRYIDRIYSPARRHSALGQISALLYEREGAPMAA